MYKKFVEKNYKELLDILNCLKVGVYITDGNGKTLLLNDESCKTGGLERSETVGKICGSLSEWDLSRNRFR